MSASTETITLTIDQGQLRGRIAKDTNGNSYKCFQGIPYAKPPIGKLRFLPPQPPEAWTDDILDATRDGNACYAPDMFTQNPIGSEDCLFLNVYTPKLPNELKNVRIPVMVWIHGGAFYIGSGSSIYYGPDFLMQKNVILVTINYRLGYLGFLSLKNSKLGATGNAGLKDQVQALRWVQQNISKFGGDPNNVTIFGESAGSASVHLLTLSPLAKGLFHKAIMQSGTGNEPWATQTRRDYEFAKLFGCTSQNDDEILEFLQNQTVEDILKMQEESFPNDLRMAGEISVVTPTIEPNVPGAFLSEPIEKIMAEGRFHQIPMMIGSTNKEGYLLCLPQWSFAVDPDFKNSEKIIPRDLRDLLKVESEILKVVNDIKEFYYGNKIPSKEILEPFEQYATDMAFIYKIQKTTKMFAAKSIAPVYNYLFKLNTGLNSFKSFFKLQYDGAVHSDEIPYIFKSALLAPVKPNTPESRGIHVMTTLWTNFAKTGNPNTLTDDDPHINIVWEPYQKNDPNYLEIDTKLKMGKEVFKERFEFWDKLYITITEKKS